MCVSTLENTVLALCDHWLYSTRVFEFFFLFFLIDDSIINDHIP